MSAEYEGLPLPHALATHDVCLCESCLHLRKPLQYKDFALLRGSSCCELGLAECGEGGRRRALSCAIR